MGAGLALHAGTIVNHNLAGIFSIGAFLHFDSMIYEKLEKSFKLDPKMNEKIPRIVMTHCSDDSVVPIEWSRTAFRQIRDCGVRIKYRTQPHGDHTVTSQQMKWFDRFIRNRLSESSLPIGGSVSDDLGDDSPQDA